MTFIQADLHRRLRLPGAVILALAALSLPALAVEPPVEPAVALCPVMPGWDGCKWNDLIHQTPKYVIGRLMACAPPSPIGIQTILPAINRYYPGSQVLDSSGMDKVDIPCVGVIDMVVNSGGKEKPYLGGSWAWQVVEDKCGDCKPNQCEEVSKTKKCGGGGGGDGGKGCPPDSPYVEKRPDAVSKYCAEVERVVCPGAYIANICCHAAPGWKPYGPSCVPATCSGCACVRKGSGGDHGGNDPLASSNASRNESANCAACPAGQRWDGDGHGGGRCVGGGGKVISCASCAAPPDGCHYTGGNCATCGTVVCQKSCVSCAAPREGCHYTGGNCATCGNLVCTNHLP